MNYNQAKLRVRNASNQQTYLRFYFFVSFFLLSFCSASCFGSFVGWTYSTQIEKLKWPQFFIITFLFFFIFHFIIEMLRSTEATTQLIHLQFPCSRTFQSTVFHFRQDAKKSRAWVIPNQGIICYFFCSRPNSEWLRWSVATNCIFLICQNYECEVH